MSNPGTSPIRLIPGYSSLPISSFPMLYGTAWKAEQTTNLVLKAFNLGFRGVDTACQPKHYQENLVGDALWQMMNGGDYNSSADSSTSGSFLKRDQIWVQTKYTSIDGQDKNKIPYDPSKSITEQVKESIEVSRENLRLETIDSLVLHGPVKGRLDLTMEAYRAMETYGVDTGKVRYLGLSNHYELSWLQQIYQEARHKPVILQNRFYSDTNFDKDLRSFCGKHNIKYQSFWTLTANPDLMRSRAVQSISKKYSKTAAQVIFRYILDQNGGATGQPLTGCKSDNHIREAVEVWQNDKGSFKLNEKEIAMIEGEMYGGRGEL